MGDRGKNSSILLVPLSPMGELKTIFQNNAITEANYDFSTLEKNIMYMMMAQIRQGDEPEKYYFISVNELSQKTGVDNSYADYKDAIERMMSKIITIRKENGNILQTTLVSSAEYIKGQGIIELGIEPKLRPYLFELKQNFTTYQLELALILKSKFSKRMYEMLSQFKNTGILRISVLDLKERLALYNPKTKEEQYEKWSAFDKYVLKIAHKEINKHTDIQFEYEAVKTGRKFTRLDFHITHTPYQVKFDFKDADTELFDKLVNKYGLRKDQAEKALSMHAPAWIKSQLYMIQVKRSNNQVTNLGAFTAKVLGV
jgi:plasmid replication initiation protein